MLQDYSFDNFIKCLQIVSVLLFTAGQLTLQSSIVFIVKSCLYVYILYLYMYVYIYIYIYIYNF